MMVPNKIHVIANWKMKPATIDEARTIASGYTASSSAKVHAVVCPPYPMIPLVQDMLGKTMSVGGQMIQPDDTGSYTGGVSGAQLKSMNIDYVIAGHSTRRAAGETDDQVNQQMMAALRNDIIPVVCIGEDVRDENGEYLKKLYEQLSATFAGIKKQQFEEIIIAYEPIWAISDVATREPTFDEVREALLYIKKSIEEITATPGVGRINIIYGGSVSDGEELAQYLDAGYQGVLIGRASLDPEAFSEIIKTAKNFSK